MSPEEARRRVEEVKADAAALWAKLLGLYEDEVHTALGYSSWGAFYEAEFGESAGRGYQLLRSAEVVAVLGAGESTDVHPASEAVARELAPLRREPERMREVWDQARQIYGPEPTGTQVKRVRLGTSRRRKLPTGVAQTTPADTADEKTRLASSTVREALVELLTDLPREVIDYLWDTSHPDDADWMVPRRDLMQQEAEVYVDRWIRDMDEHPWRFTAGE